MPSAENMKPGKCGKSWSSLYCLGSHWYSRWRSWDVILCFLMLTWWSSHESEAAKTERFSLFFACIRAIINWNSRENTVQRFSNKTSRWCSWRNTQTSDLSSEFAQISAILRASFWFIIFPWNLARLILMDKRKFLLEPKSNRILRLILQSSKVTRYKTMKNDFYLGSDRKFPFSALIFCEKFVWKLKERAGNRFHWACDAGSYHTKGVKNDTSANFKKLRLSLYKPVYIFTNYILNTASEKEG